jgi:lysozyme
MSLRTFGRRLRLFTGIALALGIVGVAAWMLAISWRPAVRDFPLQGPDIGEETGAIDWFTLKGAGADFAYVRATTGADLQDSRFAENWSGLYEAGVRRGAIHVYSLCRLAADQAANFVRTVPRSSDQLPVAIELDFQDDCPARPDRDVLVGELTRFLIAIETHTGEPTILKLAKRFDAEYRIAQAIPRSLWSMQSYFPPEYLPRPWRMWQATRMLRIAGAEQSVRWNVVAK